MKIQEIILANKKDGKRAIYSVCSAHPIIIEASLEQACKDGSIALIEATANQVNQYGGYTGMSPAEFRNFVKKIALKVDFPESNIIFGGDHLGPVCWTDKNSNEAMTEARALVSDYVSAGFKKIHLDTSMPCADDVLPLSDDIIANRAADLCLVAETSARNTFGISDIVYIIGTEVPPPGGATEDLEELAVTPVNDVKNTIELHKNAFDERGLNDVWNRVIALVVQPGVEFDNMQVIDYKSDKSQKLVEFISNVPNIAFEAHSTDYQNVESYKKLVNDHFAILKVGPQLTYALREALFSLSFIEEELVLEEHVSNLKEVCEQVMLANPSHWKKFYSVPVEQERLYRMYSFSDRIRYYWNNDKIQSSVHSLITNLEAITIPLPLISQFFPDLYEEVRANRLQPTPLELIKAKIQLVTERYAVACWKQ